MSDPISNPVPSALAQNSALLIALAALGALLTQWVLNTTDADGEGWLAELWALLRFFTILTNGLVAFVWGRIALRRAVSGGMIAGTTLSIVMVGIIYHALLVPEVPLQGARILTDLIFHTLTPIACLLWWLGFAPKRMSLRQIPYWLIWPAGYCLYALIRGQLTGSYPYFFFDIARFGVPFVAGYIAAMVSGFALIGLILWGVSRLFSSRRAT